LPGWVAQPARQIGTAAKQQIRILVFMLFRDVVRAEYRRRGDEMASGQWGGIRGQPLPVTWTTRRHACRHQNTICSVDPKEPEMNLAPITAGL